MNTKHLPTWTANKIDAQTATTVIPNITTMLAAEFTEPFSDSIIFSFIFVPSWKKKFYKNKER